MKYSALARLALSLVFFDPIAASSSGSESDELFAKLRSRSFSPHPLSHPDNWKELDDLLEYSKPFGEKCGLRSHLDVRELLTPTWERDTQRTTVETPGSRLATLHQLGALKTAKLTEETPSRRLTDNGDSDYDSEDYK
ncbi:hypothetical protein PSACC_02456 [Paramicrosporidium saccamoebae]|uniref:Uncharacterized protein n=1 Tax=Paramicrosporidium saccamoebae TaxID=1246581 RepID=A0A2H9TIZ2_9FUNG|nr:hypothetical protein PSACC_02456 [Paramicrosporidium saccamoebae]